VTKLTRSIYSPAGPVTGGVGSGSLCWQSHQVRPGQSACLRSRQAWQIMPSTLKSPGATRDAGGAVTAADLVVLS
jgi:hypothetical protein